MTWDDFEALTFDCYGTLIDWERGILGALRSLLTAHRAPDPGDESLLELFARLESEAESGPFRRYREVLRAVAAGVGCERGFDATDAQAEAFAASVGDWPPFPDTAESLTRLAARYRLAIVSNVDDDLFAASAQRLGVAFEAVVTAEQIQSYKPAPEHFLEVLGRLGLPGDRVLHVAQSLHHDIGPATDLGLSCVWVNRRAGRSGSGATRPAEATPDVEVPDLATLVRLMGLD